MKISYCYIIGIFAIPGKTNAIRIPLNHLLTLPRATRAHNTNNESFFLCRPRIHISAVSVSRKGAERLLYSGAHLRQKTSGATLAHCANVSLTE